LSEIFKQKQTHLNHLRLLCIGDAAAKKKAKFEQQNHKTRGKKNKSTSSITVLLNVFAFPESYAVSLSCFHQAM